ncbi:MAG: ABC transporter ATP-binding protein [Burkholderiaceae bacterium]
MNGALEQTACPLLATRDMRVRAGSRSLIEGLSLKVQRGQTWCVIGANGSGKTSLLHTLAGLRRPDAGYVELQGRSLSAWPLAQAARLRGLLPQALHDAFSATALDVVMMGRHPHLQRWAWGCDVDRGLALQALRSVDLEGLAQSDVLTLSGGERQRVGIAALLAQDPLLLLLDEPLAHLDLKHQISVLEHLAQLARRDGKAVMLSIHDLNLARRFATHVLLLGGAAKPRFGPVDEVMTQEALSQAFGHTVMRVNVGAQTLFVPV